MSRFWPMLRQLLSGLMVVAALALAMHAGVAAADPDAGTATRYGAEGPHRHALGEAEVKAGGEHAIGHPDATHKHGLVPCKSACCGAGSACMTGIPVGAAAALLPNSIRTSSIPAHDAPREGHHPPGLRRPPSLPANA